MKLQTYMDTIIINYQFYQIGMFLKEQMFVMHFALKDNCLLSLWHICSTYFAAKHENLKF